MSERPYFPSNSPITNRQSYEHSSDDDSLELTELGPRDYHPLQQAMQRAFPQTGPQPQSYQALQGDALRNMPQPQPLGVYHATIPANTNIQLAQIPPQIVPQLPPQIVPQLPPQIVPQLPPQIVPQLPPQIVPQLPPQIVPQLPPQIVPQLPPQIVPQLPPQLPTQLNLQVPMPDGSASAWAPDVRSLGDNLKANAAKHPGLKTQYETAIQHKITAGAQVAQQLVTATGPMNLTEKQVTDLMWYLQARGELKTNTPNAPEITYTLPDPHGNILRSLDATSSATVGGLAYQRASSHLEGFQAAAAGNAPRGINFHVGGGIGDIDRTLPNGKATILYQKMSQGTNGYPENRIFIKPEDHGMYYSKPKKPDPNGPYREPVEHDKRDAVNHGAGFFGSVLRQMTGTNSPAGSFKERLPPEIINGYQALQETAPSNMKPLLSINDPTGDSSGLHVMATNIQQALNSLGPTAATGPGTIKQALLNFQQTYVQTANPVYDNPTLRIGQEIILNTADLAPPPPRPAQQLPPQQQPLPPQQQPPQNTTAQIGTVTTTQTNPTNTNSS